ncbi:MAG: hypothetical protein AB4352_10765 [Hormoscilla sp.]
MDDIISDYWQTALQWWPIVKKGQNNPLLTQMGRLQGYRFDGDRASG